MAFYTNDELETEMRSNYFGYKKLVRGLLFYKERFEEEGVSPFEDYDIIFTIWTDRYRKQRFYYRFRIERKYKKNVVELFPITDNPNLESTIAYKSILETCIYLSKMINPSYKIYHSELQLARVTDIETLMGCPYSKRIDENFYLIDLEKVISDNYLKRYYSRLIYAPEANTLIYTEKPDIEENAK